MSASRHIDKICLAAVAAMLAATLLFMNGAALGLTPASSAPGYASRLFDTSRVHTIDIVMDDWEGFLSGCTDEEYVPCALVIDGESYKNVGFRAKGNTSLTTVASYGNDRYSFKVEFDHYTKGKNYYGLDKLCLNNLIQDNTYLKDYLCYLMMADMGVASPLCSFVYLTVNGEDWGLYLAVEGVEEAFLQRNFGRDYGELYKPDSEGQREPGGNGGPGGGMPPGQGGFPGAPEEGASHWQPDFPGAPGDGAAPEGAPPMDGVPENGRGGGGPMGGMASGDLCLQYSDDDAGSYPNIFNNAKTDVTEADQQRLIGALKTLGSGEAAEAVDVEQVIRYFVVHSFVCNDDSYTGNLVHNYYLYEKDGRLSMIPWDYNLAFGGFGMADAASVVNAPIDTPVSGAELSDRPMVAWIFADETYTALYHQTYGEFVQRWFTEGKLAAVVEQAVELISPYVEKEPVRFCSYEEFEKGVAALRSFCALRFESVSGQLSGAIPSTAQGQAGSTEAFAPVEGLELSDMGGMGGGFGPRRGDRPSRREEPQDGQGGFPPQAGESQGGSSSPPPGG